jgi:hypothetical protein
VAALLPQPTQAPFKTKYPELQVRALSPEQVKAFDGQAKHYPLTKTNPEAQAVAYEAVPLHEVIFELVS